MQSVQIVLTVTPTPEYGKPVPDKAELARCIADAIHRALPSRGCFHTPYEQGSERGVLGMKLERIQIAGWLDREYSVVEHSSFFSVRHNPSGREAVMSDGVDAIFDHQGLPLLPGRPGFTDAWEDDLNADGHTQAEVWHAYFAADATEMERDAEPLVHLVPGQRYAVTVADVCREGVTQQFWLQPSAQGLSVHFPGYGDKVTVAGAGLPLHIEYRSTTPTVCVWADINQEDPTHVINLSTAALSQRDEEEA